MVDQSIDKAKITQRLKSVEGHIRGIQKMVDEEAYCINIVNQIQAVQAALNKINSLVLDQHLHTCVTTAIQGDNVDERERVIGEILNVFAAKAK